MSTFGRKNVSRCSPQRAAGVHEQEYPCHNAPLNVTPSNPLGSRILVYLREPSYYSEGWEGYKILQPRWQEFYTPPNGSARNSLPLPAEVTGIIYPSQRSREFYTPPVDTWNHPSHYCFQECCTPL